MRRGPNKPNWPFTLNRDCEQAVGLRAWWAGGLVGSLASQDSSGMRNNATLSGFPSGFSRTSGWTDGVDGGRGAILFDGVDDEVTLEASKSAAFYYTATTAFSVSFWAKIIAQPSNTHGFMCGVRVTAVGNGWYVYWEKAGSRFLFGYQGLNNNYHFRYSSALSLNTWYHVTCTRDTSNTIGGTKIAINGADDTGATDTPGTPTDCSYIGGPLFSYGDDAQNLTYPSNCAMEDVCLYNRVLPVATIRNLFDRDTRWQKRFQMNPIILSRSGGGLPILGGPSPYHTRRSRAMSSFPMEMH